MHCATRLRFTLKNMDLADTEAIKNMNGVIDVIIQSGQYQICIGPDVNEVYKEVNKLGDFSKENKPEQTEDKKD